MRRTALALAATLATLPGLARAAEPPCLTAAEFTALASYGLPSMIKGAADRCAPALPAGSWLPQNGAQLSARYASAKPRAWPGAKAAFLKLGGTGDKQALDMIKTLPEPTQQLMVDGLIEGMVGQQLPTGRCVTVDRLVRLLSPLPPENTAEVIAIGIGLASRTGQAKFGQFSVCPAQAAVR